MIGKYTPSPAGLTRHEADRELAGQFGALLSQAQHAERSLRDAQAARAMLPELRRLGLNLDQQLTAVMRAAFAAQRAEIGPRGYEDRIFRRRAMATAPVHAWTQEAERLLTLRERHRLTGIPRLPRTPGSVPQHSGASALH